jgi:hypothetical protein
MASAALQSNPDSAGIFGANHFSGGGVASEGSRWFQGG